MLLKLAFGRRVVVVPAAGAAAAILQAGESSGSVGESVKVTLQGAQKEQLFTVVLCSCVPEMIANIMHGSSQASVGRAIVSAVRQQIISDPELRKQHKAVAAMYRQRGAMPAQVHTAHCFMCLMFTYTSHHCFCSRNCVCDGVQESSVINCDLFSVFMAVLNA
jgi:hypothetical protein